MTKTTAEKLDQMAGLLKEIDGMIAVAARATTVCGHEGDQTAKIRFMAATDQAEALREQIRKYRSWLKIRGFIEDLRESIVTLAAAREAEAMGRLAQLATDLQKFGEEEICPFSDFDVLNSMAEKARKRDEGET